jgi:predicted nucleic acid-binding protein
MKILIDTNVVLDFLLQREPFFQDTERLFQAVGNGEVVGYVTATTLTDIFYIARRHTQNLASCLRNTGCDGRLSSRPRHFGISVEFQLQ